MNVFSPPPLQGHPIVALLYFRYDSTKKAGGLFRDNLPPNYFERDVVFVERVEDAECIVLPNNFLSDDSRMREYVAEYACKGEEHSIPVLVFSFGDLTHTLRFDPRVFVARLSTYRSLYTKRDIVIPTLVDDPAPQGIIVREKRDIPVVSFCGQAAYRTFGQWVRYGVKVFLFSLVSVVRPKLKARLVGVFWRRASIRACQASTLVATHFIVRGSFSGSSKTIELAPEEARKQFVENMRESDFVLAPKGDGNYSNRFLEALAAGRIPVVIDTDIVLPFEDEIDYTRICIRVPMRDIYRTPRYIRELYDSLSPEEWASRQHNTRHIFEMYMRQDVALARVLTSLKYRKMMV